ncbi:MAG TPA: STAS domain-containing protein [Gammaproteobacteria bacterium]|jgi:ABC-type transporter Mla MlaB component|nr:STAS domain-containing protein [Gammaproteobacteria bacterium]
MTDITLKYQDNDNDNKFTLSGELNFTNVMSVYQQSLDYLNASITTSNITVDFSQLHASNSAAIALMVAWLQLAQQQNKQLHFQQVPAGLLSIIKAARMEAVFG